MTLYYKLLNYSIFSYEVSANFVVKLLLISIIFAMQIFKLFIFLYKIGNFCHFLLIDHVFARAKIVAVRKCIIKVAIIKNILATWQLHEYKPRDEISLDRLLWDNILQLKSPEITTLLYINFIRYISVVIGVISTRRSGHLTAPNFIFSIE